MTVFGLVHKLETLILFVGDIVVFYISLWLTLFLRQLEIPTSSLIATHAVPFTILFAIWLIVFFVARLYEKHTTILRSKIPILVFNTQVINSVIAILFFYLIPYFGITPKTVLFLYLIISFFLILIWRQWLISFVGRREQQSAVLIGSGSEMRELLREVNGNPRYGLKFVSSINVDATEALDFEKEIIERIYSEEIHTIVVDTKSEEIIPILPRLYNLVFEGVRFVDMHLVYEDIFDRVPLSLLTYDWFLAYLSSSSKIIYGVVKRIFDLISGLLLGVVTVVLLPFVFLAIKLDDNGSIFITQERVGKHNRRFFVRKFRTMKQNDSGEWHSTNTNTVTRVGRTLRRTSIDELPQFLNLLKGDISIVGPRSDIVGIAMKLAEEIPYYNIRHIVKPGITGWAQTHQRYAPGNISPQSIEEAKIRLAYDLYYAKNRSVMLDIRIALKTLGTLIARLGA